MRSPSGHSHHTPSRRRAGGPALPGTASASLCARFLCAGVDRGQLLRKLNYTARVTPEDMLSDAGTPDHDAQADDARFAAALALATTRFTRNAQYFAGTPVSSADWRTIRIVATEGPMRIGELARLERYTAASATVLVNRLVDQGLLARRPDPDDARSRLLTATPEGLARCAEWEEQLGRTVADLLAALPESQQDTLRAALPILQRLTRQLNALRKERDNQ